LFLQLKDEPAYSGLSHPEIGCGSGKASIQRNRIGRANMLD
jgi:hypothetical protein